MTSPLVKSIVTLAALSSACRPQILSWDGRLEYEIGVTLQDSLLLTMVTALHSWDMKISFEAWTNKNKTLSNNRVTLLISNFVYPNQI